MRRLLGHIASFAVVGILLATTVANEAKAAYIISISITDITTSTTTAFSVAKGGPNDVTDPGTANAANIITVGGTFNTSATGLTLTGLNSVTNNPGTSIATMSISGTAAVVGTSTDKFLVTITTSQTDFTSPTGPVGMLANSESSTITNTTGAAGDMQSVKSWYNPANTIAAAGPATPLGSYPLPVTGTTPLSLSSPTFTAGVSVAPTPYALVNQVMIQITGGGSTPNAKDVFGSATTLTAGGVPEPASIVMFLTGMPLPLVVVGLLRRRRRAAA